MKDALPVSFFHGGANLFENVHDPIKRQPCLFGQHVAECAAVEIFHHQIGDTLAAGAREAEVSYIDDVRMAQTSGGPRFTLEPLDKLLIAHELRDRKSVV